MKEPLQKTNQTGKKNKLIMVGLLLELQLPFCYNILTPLYSLLCRETSLPLLETLQQLNIVTL